MQAAFTNCNHSGSSSHINIMITGYVKGFSIHKSQWKPCIRIKVYNLPVFLVQH